MKYRNKLSLYCNFTISPIEDVNNTMATIPGNIIAKTHNIVVNHFKFDDKTWNEIVIKQLDNKIISWSEIITKYAHMCTASSINSKEDEDGYIIYDWDLENIQLTPKMKKEMVELIYNALIDGLDGKHIRLNTNWPTALNVLRYYVFKEKLKDTDIEIIFNDNNEIKKYRINSESRFIDENGNVVKIPSGFFDCDLDELLEMM